MALVSGSPEMSLLVRNRVGSSPTLIIIVLPIGQKVSLVKELADCLIQFLRSFGENLMVRSGEVLETWLEVWRRSSATATSSLLQTSANA